MRTLLLRTPPRATAPALADGVPAFLRVTNLAARRDAQHATAAEAF